MITEFQLDAIGASVHLLPFLSESTKCVLIVPYCFAWSCNGCVPRDLSSIILFIVPSSSYALVIVRRVVYHGTRVFLTDAGHASGAHDVESGWGKYRKWAMNVLFLCSRRALRSILD